MTAPSATAGWPEGPTLGERLLLRAIREWTELKAAQTPPNRPVAQALAFRASNRVAGLFVAWMQMVEATLRRPLQSQCSVCGGVSQDEQRLLVSCGLAAAAPSIGEELLEPLLFDARPCLVMARALNAALAAEGYALPVRLREAPPEPPPVEGPTVH